MKSKLIIFTLVCIPVILYLFLVQFGSNVVKPLPYYGPKTLLKTKEGKQDTLFYSIPSPLFKQANGTALTQDSLQNNIYIVSFVKPNTKSSQRVLGNLDNVYNKVKNFKEITFISLTDSSYVNAEYFNYIKPFNKPLFKWYFLNASTKVLYNYATTKLLFNNSSNTSELNFLENTLVALVDKENRIRGQYDLSIVKEGKRLAEDTKMLITNYSFALKKLKDKK